MACVADLLTANLIKCSRLIKRNATILEKRPPWKILRPNYSLVLCVCNGVTDATVEEKSKIEMK